METKFIASIILPVSGAAVVLASCSDRAADPEGAADVPEPKRLTYEIVETYPHDPAASTQGLLLYDGAYYESTGGYGTSSLRRVDPKSGNVLKWHSLRATAFGEGLALRDELLYQLDWRGGVGFIYERETFEPIGNFRYKGEGWGLTWDGEKFVLSDGTASLRFLTPRSFALVDRVEVRNHLGPVDLLNELEFVEGKVFANRWHHDEILVIDPDTGAVEATLDLAELERPRPRVQDAALNGIAFDPETRLLHVTGKRWTRVYVLRIEG